MTSSFSEPAFRALPPRLVDADELAAAIAAMVSGLAAARYMGTAIPAVAFAAVPVLGGMVTLWRTRAAAASGVGAEASAGPAAA